MKTLGILTLSLLLLGTAFLAPAPIAAAQCTVNLGYCDGNCTVNLWYCDGGYWTQCKVNAGWCTNQGYCTVNLGYCDGFFSNCTINVGDCYDGGTCVVNLGTCTGPCLVNTGSCWFVVMPDLAVACPGAAAAEGCRLAGVTVTPTL